MAQVGIPHGFRISLKVASWYSALDSIPLLQRIIACKIDKIDLRYWYRGVLAKKTQHGNFKVMLRVGEAWDSKDKFGWIFII